MKYNLCHSCMYYESEIKTPFLREPARCTQSEVIPLFGSVAGGFISGIDVMHCDYFTQYPASYGDVAVELTKGGIVGYVIPKERKEKKMFVLTDNSKNVVHKNLNKFNKSYEKQHPPKYPKRLELEESFTSDDISTYGLAWCPF